MPIVAAAVEYVEGVAKKINTAIELPGEVIRMLQVGGEDLWNAPRILDTSDVQTRMQRGQG